MKKVTIWPVIFSVFFTIFAWRSIYSIADDFLGYFMATMILGIFAVVAFCIGIGLALLIGLIIPKRWSEPETTKLVSLRGSEGINGNFFLGTGSIGTSQYYFFYKEVGKGYQPGRIEIDDNVMVFEEERQYGEIKTYTYQFVNPSLQWIAMDSEIEKHEFFIPDGSLKKDFVLK